MRLLDTSTLQFKWFDDPHEVRYAILSHVWAKDGEQTLQKRLDQEDSEFNKILSPKIRKACEVARQHEFQYIWIDSCCIDKTSSAELSEALNSMYRWYRCAEVCYAHLWDVEDGDNPHITNSQFRRAEWFKRGWTLQELLAPNTVLFLSKTWAVIGTKHSLAKDIHDVTSIDTQILRGRRKLSDASVAERMSWASDRVTTKVEDRASSHGVSAVTPSR
ncbi:HET-domain-containing protein [Dichomitus squalens LYAD-421 SS1]|uniref:HET-domain-containing protein n=1 Tax=Dichomitus squalens (strain LYAD-421) TaxID=732165 RepID=UPI0004415993|nr:HET-domain-containing protein [Dichomitus squalens LYAD-421 SS1]EJF65597.1 HET-domain-containing protein [Dichomitus squalens LYAD-421 SS1]